MKFKFEEVVETVAIKSEVPASITNKLLERATFDTVPIGTLSATLDDFLLESMRLDKSSEEMQKELTTVFSGLKDRFDVLKDDADTIDWESLVSEDNISSIREQLVSTVIELGANEDVVDKVKDINFEMSDSVGVSHAGKNATVARLQILRKTQDYMVVFPESNFEDVLKTLFLTTMAHEAGHIIDKEFGIYTNRIPANEKWLGSENKSERFAEFWGRLIEIEGVSQEIREQEKLMHVSKTKEVWDALQVYSKKNPGVGIQQLFNIIMERSDDETLPFLDARRIFYASIPPECYASPYSIDDLRPPLI